MTQFRHHFRFLPFRRECCAGLSAALLVGSVFGALWAKSLNSSVLSQSAVLAVQMFSSVPLIRRILRAALLPALLSLLLITRKRVGFYLLFFIKGGLLSAILCRLQAIAPQCCLQLLIENLVSLPVLLFSAAVWQEESSRSCQHLSLLGPAILFGLLGVLLSSLFF